MLSSINRYKWVAVPLIGIVLIAIFWQSILGWILGGSPPPPTDSTVTATLSTSPSQNVVHICLDTPPLYSSKLASQAASTLAEKLNGLVEPGSSGMVVYVSYITSHSYQDDALSFTIPAIGAFPSTPSQPVYGSDPYKNSIAKGEYQKKYTSWQKTITQLQTSLSQQQAQVKAQTDKLRNLKYPFDPNGSDIRGCLVEASQHFQGVKGTKTLLIASDLVSTTSAQQMGNFALSGVIVKVIWHTCAENPATCSTNDGYWKQQMLRAGAKSVAFFDPATSNALHVSI